MTDQSSLFNPGTLPDTRNVTSSLALESGAMPPASLDGETSEGYGPEVVHANPGQLPDVAVEPPTQGICGLTFSGSSTLADLPLFSASRCQEVPSAENASLKKCSGCGEAKTLRDFYRTRARHASSTGYHARCKDCCRIYQEKYRTTSPERRSATFKKYREGNRARVLVSAARYRAKQAGIPFNLDEWVPELQARIDNGKCELSGMPFRLDGGRTWDSPSLDRVIPADGYVITNVRVVLFALNVMMNTWGEEPVLQIAENMRRTREERDADPLAKWEQRLKERLARFGSTESPLIWTKSITPSGVSISRLAPWTPLTFDSDFTGARWSTARASDGDKGSPNQAFTAGGQPLPAQMHQASRWATATARDYRSGAASPATHAKNARPLNEQMTPPSSRWPTVTVLGNWNKKGISLKAGDGLATIMDGTAPGTPTTSGSNATTARKDVPHPTLPCWLQGLPEEYLCGEVLAGPSTRNWRKK